MDAFYCLRCFIETGLIFWGFSGLLLQVPQEAADVPLSFREEAI